MINIKKKSGFTLVELMVTISILGILMAIGAPSYKRYIMRSMQAEAKEKLTLLYTAEKSYFSDNNTYTACLSMIGYEHGASGKHYYSSGMSAAALTADPLHNLCGPGTTGTQDCLCYSYDSSGNCLKSCTNVVNVAWFRHSSAMNNSVNCDPDVNFPSVTPWISSQTFNGGASGSINSGSSNCDMWTIDNNRNLNNVSSGL